MAKIRFFFALWVGKIIFFFTRLLGRGGGTAAPGLIARRISTAFTPTLSQQLVRGSVVITGTNGKTTTSRILSSILSQADHQPLHNRAGSNLMRGIASTLIQNSNWQGKIKADLGLWETDEFTLLQAVKELKPKIVTIANLFRDQLDRYGELDTIKKGWQKALSRLPTSATVILNADDPNLASLGQALKAKVVYFGIADQSFTQKELPHSADCKQCPQCGHFLSFASCFFSHLSRQYSCSHCHYSHPENNLFCSKILFKNTKSAQVVLKGFEKDLKLKINLSGVYNVYNLLAAASTAQALKIPAKAIQAGVSNFRPAFGRIEEISIGVKKILLLLCKNPAGFDQVLETLARKGKKLNLLIAINDLIADGRDVSWLWDVNFELLKDKVKNLVVSGIRAEDIALRLKYAELGNEKGKIKIKKDFWRAINWGLDQTAAKETLFILPTYTAMLAIRKILNRKGLVHQSWAD